MRMKIKPMGPCVVLALAGCGGGNDLLLPGHWETAEYRAQAGLGLIHASSMYARGGTGKGVVVGLLDSGATPDHPDLSGKYDIVDSFDGVDPMDSNPVNGGHGTHVAGILAAHKNDSGMHGVAYDATLASYALEFDRNDDVDDFELGKATDELSAAGVRVVNNSWSKVDLEDNYRTITITDVTRAWVDDYFPHGLPAYRRYVGAGGVQVWGTGNRAQPEPSFHAGLPVLVPELEEGWLAVTAIGLDGDLASYAERCGSAAAWCIAAPGGDRGDAGIWSTVPASPGGGPGVDRDGGSGGDAYRALRGTSMAAPHVSGALAGLKSMFPNLSYHEVRDRLLFSANRTGIYADPLVYGQGLLDLDAASRPIGGTSFTAAEHAGGTVIATDGAGLRVPARALSGHLAHEEILILDGYQRAPFVVPIGAFAVSGGSYLSMHDLDLVAPQRTWTQVGETLSLGISGDGFHVSGVSNGAWSFGAGRGAGLAQGFALVAGAGLPHGGYRMDREAVGVALGFASDAGELHASALTSPESAAAATSLGAGAGGFGIGSWRPRSVVAASFMPAQSDHAYGISFASGLERPSGWHGSGAFELSGASVDVGYRRILHAGGTVTIGMEGRLAHLAPNDGPLVALDDALVAATGFDLSVAVATGTTLNAGVSMERPIASGELRIRAARSVDEAGRIAYDDIVMDQGDFLGFDRIGVHLSHEEGPSARYGAGIVMVRDGFGEMETIVGARAQVRFH